MENVALPALSTILHQYITDKFGREIANSIGIRIYFKQGVPEVARRGVSSRLLDGISKSLAEGITVPGPQVFENAGKHQFNSRKVNNQSSRGSTSGSSTRSYPNRVPSATSTQNDRSTGLASGQTNSRVGTPPASTKGRRTRPVFTTSIPHTDDPEGGYRKLVTVVAAHNPSGRYGTKSDYEILEKYGIRRTDKLMNVKLSDVFAFAHLLLSTNEYAVVRKTLSIVLGNRRTASEILDIRGKSYAPAVIERAANIVIQIPRLVSSGAAAKEFVFIDLLCVEDSKRWADICGDIDDDDTD